VAVAMSQVSSIQHSVWTPLPCCMSKFVDNGAGVFCKTTSRLLPREKCAHSSDRRCITQCFLTVVFIFALQALSRLSPITCAGLPATILNGSTGRVTWLLMPTTAWAPITTPSTTPTLAPSQTSSSSLMPCE
jgi:hypothetical protein